MPKGKLKKASEDSRAAGIRKAVGTGPDDEVEVTTPTFKRPKSWKAPKMVPVGGNLEAFFGSLPLLSEDSLRTLGMRIFDRTSTGLALWLFPVEWYSKIPKGFVIVDIYFRRETFEVGVTTNAGLISGLLPYGILK